MMDLFEDLGKGLIRKIKDHLSHADEIISTEIMDPTYGGYVETKERYRIKVVYKYKGKRYTTYFNTLGAKPRF